MYNGRISSSSLILLILNILFCSQIYAHDVDSHDDPDDLDFFISAGSTTADSFSAISLRLGLVHQENDSRYTYLYSSSVNFDSFFDHFNDAFICLGPKEKCEEESDKIATLTEFTILYGKKYKSTWLSAGIGYIKGKNFERKSSSELYDFSTVGLAYSALWIRPFNWLWLNLELSGNINSKNNITTISWRYTF